MSIILERYHQEALADAAPPKAKHTDFGRSQPIRYSRIDLICKRLLDIAVCLLALPFALPLGLLIAALIKLDSSGPALFIQQRVGTMCVNKRWWLRTFPIYKFRTMTHKADEGEHKKYIEAYVNGTLEASEDENAKFKMSGDSRVTRFGRILRATSLDELPQLINILKGDMSIVGPRPLPIYEVDQYDDWHYARFGCPAGLTGYWQVYGRGQATFDEQIQMDIDYVQNRSVMHDVKLMFLTVPAVISGKGAK